MAEKHGCSTAQLALAWVLHQGNDVIPIPGMFLRGLQVTPLGWLGQHGIDIHLM
ncbi:hypothetical protein R6Q59_035750 [Mikania micrantha]